MRLAPLSLALAVVVLTGCAPDAQIAESSGLGGSGLAPSIQPEAKHAKPGNKRARDAETKRTEHPKAKPSNAKASQSAATRTRPAKRASAAASSTAPAAPTVLTASLTDPAGDVQGSLTKAPDYVDVVGATLTRGTDQFTLRVSFAGAVPGSDTDKTENVASFFDLDGDGQLDYEVWATLADNGWSGSYVTPRGSRFGAETRVTAHPDGHDLVIRFPLAHLERAAAFRWSVGAEWGSYEQLASGTTAKDNAPDSGVVAFPR